jgi:hypothetical protein
VNFTVFVIRRLHRLNVYSSLNLSIVVGTEMGVDDKEDEEDEDDRDDRGDAVVGWGSVY